MKIYGLIFTCVLFVGLYEPCRGIFGSTSLQDYIDSFIDAVKFKFDGVIDLNETSIGQIWSFFKTKYNRVYESLEEEKQRLHIFRDHLRFVLESNLRKFRTFQLELNEFGDWTLDEFNEFKKGLITLTSSRRNLFIDESNDEDLLRRSLKKLYQHHYRLRRLKRNLNKHRHHHKRLFGNWISNLFNRDRNKPNPADQIDVFDWRNKSVVSSVKNQRKCGACYAFATATIMETLYAMKTNSSSIIDFSPQQITDCSSNGNNGCKGGHFIPSVRYLSDNGGKIATDASYPYAAAKKQCRTNDIDQVYLGNIQYESLPEGDEKRLEEAVTTYGPVFIGLDAESRRFMFYRSGVLKIDNCPTRRQDMDHAMVIVGYGYDKAVKMPYWIIKNSWGTRWGENGYLRLVKDSGNMCGVASMAYYGKLT